MSFSFVPFVGSECCVGIAHIFVASKYIVSSLFKIFLFLATI